MDPNLSNEPVQQHKLPTWLTTVTTFSKLLAMILFISLPFLGFYLGMKYQEKLTVSPPIVSEVQKTTIPAIDPTAGWNTYTNTKYNYAFKYPSDWTIVNESSINQSLLDIVSLMPANKKIDNNFSAPIQLERIDNPKNLSLSDWNDWYNSTSVLARTVYKPDTTMSEVNGITVYINSKGQCEPLSCYQVIFKGNDNLFNFTNIDFSNDPSSGYSKQDLESNQKIFNTIVSTFKFTDQNTQIDPTVSWKTYTSTTGKFTFKYPSAWNEVSGGSLATGTESNSFGPNVSSTTEDLNSKMTIQMQHPSKTTGITDAMSYLNAVAKGISPTNFSLDNVSAYRLNYPNSGTASDVVALSENNIIYVITLGQHGISTISASDENLFNQILSTFKFTQ